MTTDSLTTDQRTWYLATLGRNELLARLAPLDLPPSHTQDPLACAQLARTAPGGPAVRQAAEEVLQPLVRAATFTISIPFEDETVAHAGLVPVIDRRTEGALTGLYAEVMLFELDSTTNRAAFRLSRLPDERHWVIDTRYGPGGAPVTDQPFGSARTGRRLTVPPAVAAELDRLAGTLSPPVPRSGSCDEPL